MLDVTTKCFIKNTKIYNPNWRNWKYIMYPNQPNCRNHIKEFRPDLLNIYDNFSFNISKYDLWRFVIIQKFGGFYMDMDIEIIKPLDTLIDNKCVFAIEGYCDDVSKHGIATYMFAATPNNNFIELVINKIFDNSKNKSYIENNYESYDNLTGPKVVYDVYKNYYLKDEITLLPYTMGGSTFGEYAIHHAAGSWKHELKLI
jgi:mannosyltransferase OCH1-like enzyme